jgi:hypothetical protein
MCKLGSGRENKFAFCWQENILARLKLASRKMKTFPCFCETFQLYSFPLIQLFGNNKKYAVSSMDENISFECF